MPRKGSSTIDALAITALFKDGLGIGRLSRHFKKSKSAIDKRLKALGLSSEGRSHLKKDRGACRACDGVIAVRRNIFCSSICAATYNNSASIKKIRPPRATPGPKPVKPVRMCATCGTRPARHRYCSDACNPLLSSSEEERKNRKRLKNLLAVRRYQARLISQIPHDADHGKIKEIYAMCPVGYEVDHRVSISKGGSHHQDNLQYLLKTDNRKKSNKLDWDPCSRVAEGT